MGQQGPLERAEPWKFMRGEDDGGKTAQGRGAGLDLPGWLDGPCQEGAVLMVFTVTTTTIQYRQIWNPKNAVTLYSGIGIGLIIDDELLACPEFTLLGARYGGEHFYFFAEGTLGLIATFAHLGVGWHF